MFRPKLLELELRVFMSLSLDFVLPLIPLRGIKGITSREDLEESFAHEIKIAHGIKSLSVILYYSNACVRYFKPTV